MKQRLILPLLVLAFLVTVSLANVPEKDGSEEAIDLESDFGLLTEIASEGELKEFGDHLKSLILAGDAEGLKRYLEYGVQGPNDVYTREQTFQMLADTSSWLYKRFFAGAWSIREFLLEYPEAVADFSGTCQYYSLSFAPPGGKRGACYILVFKDSGRLYLWDFPACPSF